MHTLYLPIGGKVCISPFIIVFLQKFVWPYLKQKNIHPCRAWEMHSFFAAPAPFFSQAAPAPDFFPKRLRLLILLFSSGSGSYIGSFTGSGSRLLSSLEKYFSKQTTIVKLEKIFFCVFSSRSRIIFCGSCSGSRFFQALRLQRAINMRVHAAPAP